MSLSRSGSRWVGLGLAGALVLGSGVAVAVAATGGDGVVETTETTASTAGTDDTVTTTSPEDTASTTTPTTSADTTGDPVADAAEVPATRYWGEECGDGPVTNHGQYVAGQPRDGQSRSSAAQSECGKPLAPAGEDPDEGSESPEAGTVVEDDPAEPGPPVAPPGQAKQQDSPRGGPHQG